MAVALKVIVVGGGICGLSSAIALRRAGHCVTVYEKYPVTADSGAGIAVPSNAARILKQWGLDLEGVGMMCMIKGVILDGKTLDVRQVQNGPWEAEEVGEWFHLTTRRDLRMVLLKEAEKDSDGAGQIDIEYEKGIVDYDPRRPAVQFSDGSWKEADLVIACDGIKSKGARRVVGFDNPATPTGLSAFRLLIPSERLMQSQLIRDICTRERDSGTTWFAVEHPGRTFVWWSCHFGEIHGVDVVMPDNEKYASSEEWLATCDKSLLVEDFQHWHPVFMEILRAADDPLLWKICAREPLDQLHNGRLCILGDALHPMPPFTGQGGGQSIEDAAALESCFSDISSAADIAIRLKLLEELRIPRVATIQLLSHCRLDDPELDAATRQVIERCRVYFKVGEQMHLENRKSLMSWILKYDVREEANAALRELKHMNSVV